ncbi:hypothetical protein NDU88_005310 [Pleurodeles waltl]|uniref:Uncharacterized protein n=1 Tax=Pleurodeles waltl TaxID=8319 RepID=A0AAV7UJ77_PLEWA|nr:hypothetical protein NDU88_005310 [Pleurodeles waltl]
MEIIRWSEKSFRLTLHLDAIVLTNLGQMEPGLAVQIFKKMSINGRNIEIIQGPGVQNKRGWSERKLPGGVRGSNPKDREDPGEEETPRIVGKPRGPSPTGTKNHCGPNPGRRPPAPGSKLLGPPRFRRSVAKPGTGLGTGRVREDGRVDIHKEIALARAPGGRYIDKELGGQERGALRA